MYPSSPAPASPTYICTCFLITSQATHHNACMRAISPALIGFLLHWYSEVADARANEQVDYKCTVHTVHTTYVTPGRWNLHRTPQLRPLLYYCIITNIKGVAKLPQVTPKLPRYTHVTWDFPSQFWACTSLAYWEISVCSYWLLIECVTVCVL